MSSANPLKLLDILFDGRPKTLALATCKS